MLLLQLKVWLRLTLLLLGPNRIEVAYRVSITLASDESAAEAGSVLPIFYCNKSGWMDNGGEEETVAQGLMHSQPHMSSALGPC